MRRFSLLAPPSPAQRSGRLALGIMLSTVIVALVVAVPVVSGPGRPASSVTFDSSESAAVSISSGDSPVVMGRDGRPPVSPSGGPPEESTSTSSAPAGTEPTVEETLPEAAVAAEPPSSVESSSADTGATSSPPAPSSPASSSPPTAAGAPVADSAAGTTASTAPSSAATATATVTEATATGTTAAPAASAARVVALVNEARRNADCPALVPEGGLAASAQENSQAMAADGTLVPAPDLGARAAAVASGGSERDVVAAWLDDRDDRAAILDCSMTSIGVGVDDGPDGPWWTQLLS